MFVNENEQEVTLPEPGVHRMKVISHAVTDNGWSLKFKKGSFEVTGFGDNPYLKEEDGSEVWMKRVGGWLVRTKIFFGKIMGAGEVNRVVKEVEANVVAKYPTTTEQFESIERIRESVKALNTALLAAATPYLKNLWFDVTLEAGIYLDNEGNEKPTLKLPKKSAENKYSNGYQVSADQTEEMVNVAGSAPAVNESPADTTEQVPDWVNEGSTVETEVSPRVEPTDLDW